MNRIPIIIAALGLAACATAEAALGQSTTSIGLSLDSTHAVRTFVDAAPRHTASAPNDSPGDTVILHAPLLDTSGRRVGVIDVSFVTTAAGTSLKHDGSEQLTGTLKLAGGELAVLGSVGAFARTTNVAIVGGTGRYAGTRGYVTALFSPGRVKLRLHLS